MKKIMTTILVFALLCSTAFGAIPIAFAEDIFPGEHSTSQGTSEKEAFETYKKAADSGDITAYGQLAIFYMFGGDGIEIDEVEALRLLKEGITKGNVECKFHMAIFTLIMGIDTGLSEGDAVELLKEVAGDKESEFASQAMMYLGEYYYRFADEPEMAKEWYKKAVDAGEIQPMTSLGDIWLFCDEDVATATEWYEKAAEAGDGEAMYMLGLLDSFYTYKPDDEKDYAKGKELMEKAIEAGYPEAGLQLGWFYIYDYHIGVKQDLKKALDIFSAAETGSLDAARTINDLGVELCTGSEYLAANPAMGVEYFEKAAELGWLDAMYNVALAYYNGESVKVDYVTAGNWLIKCIEESETGEWGDIDTTQYVNLLNWCGSLSAWKDSENYHPEDAFRFFEFAAERGSIPAMANLGKAYYTGMGTAIDQNKASEWFKKSGGMDPAFVNSEGWFGSD